MFRDPRGSVRTALFVVVLSVGMHPSRAEERHAYFGETHVHTAFSLDAYIGGNRILPHDSYRFAKGEDVVVNGVVHNIGRPLDWAAVTDHAVKSAWQITVDAAREHNEPGVFTTMVAFE